MTSFEDALLGDRYRQGGALPKLLPVQADVRDRLIAEAPDPDAWEAADCLCGAAGGRVLSEVDRHGLPYRKVLCRRCGLLRVTPRWNQARYARFYETEYRDLYSPLRAADARMTVQDLSAGPGARLVGDFVMQAWRRHGRPELDHPVIVEIGAGGGWNLSRLPAQWRRIGYDFDERFLALGREAFGVDMRRGFFDEALEAAATADCVLMSHVLEHVDDPVSVLRRLCDSARADTLILVEVPGVFRLHKTSVDPMRYWQNAHTYTFCARTASDTCRRAGLEPVAVDEWIRLVLKPSRRSAAKPADDPALARSVERYLRFCEAVRKTSDAVSSMPAAARLVRRTGDAIVRAVESAGLLHGVRAGRLKGERS
jgi:SAM-dependent methyltransferase